MFCQFLAVENRISQLGLEQPSDQILLLKRKHFFGVPAGKYADVCREVSKSVGDGVRDGTDSRVGWKPIFV
jgi:hypothetical protein